MLVSIVLLLINRLMAGLFWGSLVVFVNLPFVCIQRYNRIRFLRIREKLLRQDKQNAERLIEIVKNLNVVDSR